MNVFIHFDRNIHFLRHTHTHTNTASVFSRNMCPYINPDVSESVLTTDVDTGNTESSWKVKTRLL